MFVTVNRVRNSSCPTILIEVKSNPIFSWACSAPASFVFFGWSVKDNIECYIHTKNCLLQGWENLLRRKIELEDKVFILEREVEWRRERKILKDFRFSEEKLWDRAGDDNQTPGKTPWRAAEESDGGDQEKTGKSLTEYVLGNAVLQQGEYSTENAVRVDASRVSATRVPNKYSRLRLRLIQIFQKLISLFL